MSKFTEKHYFYSLISNGVSGNRLHIIDSVIAPVEFQTIGSDGGEYSILVRFKTKDTNTALSVWQTEASMLDFRQETAVNIKAPFNIGIRNNKLHFGRTADGSVLDEVFLSTRDVNDGGWHWALFTINDDTLKMFIDGKLDSEHTFVTATGDCSVGDSIAANLAWLGRSGNTGGFAASAEASIPEIAIWEKDLSAAQKDLYFTLTDLKSAGGDYTQAMVDSLKWWGKPFDGSGTNVSDETDFGNNGTIVGAGIIWTGDTPHKRLILEAPYTQSLDMTAANARIDQMTTYDPVGGFTLYIVNNPSSLAGTKTLYSQEDGTGQGRDWARYLVGELGFSLGGSSKTFNNFNGVVDEWSIMALRYDPVALTYDLIVDGEVRDSQSITAEAADGNHIMGESKVGTSDFVGLNASMALYTVAHDIFTIRHIQASNVYEIQNSEYIFPFEDTITGTITDTSGNGNNGTNTNGIASTDTPNVPLFTEKDFLYSLGSNGTAGNRLAVITTSIAPTELQTIGEDGGSYSVLIRFKTADTNTGVIAWMSGASMLCFRQNAGALGHAPFNVGVTNNKLHFGRTQEGGGFDETFFSTRDINDDDWHWALCTVNDVTLKIHIDGELDSTHTFVTATGDCSVGDSIATNFSWLSRNTDGGGYSASAKALVAEVAVWEEDLSAAQKDLYFILTDFENLGGTYTQAMVDSLRYWGKPKEGEGLTVADETSFGNDGTITNVDWSPETPF